MIPAPKTPQTLPVVLSPAEVAQFLHCVAAPKSADYRDRYEALTGCSLRVCPRCHDGQMRIVERLIGAPTRPRIVDTS